MNNTHNGPTENTSISGTSTLFSTKNRLLRLLKVAHQAFGHYKIQIITLTGLGFLSGLLEGIGITAIIPLFSFLAEGESSAANIVTKTLNRAFDLLHIPFTITYVLIFIAVLFIFKAIATFLSRYISILIQTSYIKETRLKLFKNFLSASWPYLSKQKIGQFEKFITHDVEFGASLLVHFTTVIILLVNTLIYTTIAFNISPRVTIISLVVGGLMLLIFKPLVYKSKIASRESSQIMKDGAHLINESMLGIKTIKVASSENIAIHKADAIFTQWKALKIRTATLANFTNSALQPVAVLLILVLFAISYKTGIFTFASFAVIVYAINRIFTHIQQGQSQLHHVNERYPFLINIIKQEEESKKYEEVAEGSKAFSFNHQIELKDVSYSHNKKDPAIQSINFKILKGSTTGIIGPSGSGKTTVVDLMLQLITPNEGTILIDDTPIKNINLKKWRENIGYMSQDFFLFNDTIRNNITLYSEKITDEDIVYAAKAADIYPFIESLDKGFETLVGERGVNLSGGQRQRIVLARVLAQRPKILILDEATSSLDTESQEAIQKSINSLKGTITIIVIAHRPSTIIDADNVIVLENGRVTEQGAPKEMLLNTSSYLYKISQNKGDN